MWTGTPASRGFTKFLDFGLSIRVASPGSPLAMARNADGRLEVFGIAANGVDATTSGRRARAVRGRGGRVRRHASPTSRPRPTPTGASKCSASPPTAAISHKWQSTAGGAWSPWTTIAGHARERRDRPQLRRPARGLRRRTRRTSPTTSAQATPGGTWSAWSTLRRHASPTSRPRRTPTVASRCSASRSNGARLAHVAAHAPAALVAVDDRSTATSPRIAIARSYDGRLEVFGTNASRTSRTTERKLTPGRRVVGVVALRRQLHRRRRRDQRRRPASKCSRSPAERCVSHRWQPRPGGTWSPLDDASTARSRP